MDVGRSGADVQNHLADRTNKGVHLVAIVSLLILHGPPAIDVFLPLLGGAINPKVIASPFFDGLVLFACISPSRSLNKASVQNHVLFLVDQTALLHLLKMFAEDELADLRVGEALSVVPNGLW